MRLRSVRGERTGMLTSLMKDRPRGSTIAPLKSLLRQLPALLPTEIYGTHSNNWSSVLVDPERAFTRRATQRIMRFL